MLRKFLIAKKVKFLYKMAQMKSLLSYVLKMAKKRQTGEFEIEDVYQKSENIQLGWTNIWAETLVSLN